MLHDEVLKRLNEIFCEVFDDESITISDDTTANDIDEWDSLMHITLVSEIEDAFDIRFEMKAIATMKNVGEMVDLICEII